MANNTKKSHQFYTSTKRNEKNISNNEKKKKYFQDKYKILFYFWNMLLNLVARNFLSFPRSLSLNPSRKKPNKNLEEEYEKEKRTQLHL